MKQIKQNNHVKPHACGHTLIFNCYVYWTLLPPVPPALP